MAKVVFGIGHSHDSEELLIQSVATIGLDVAHQRHRKQRRECL